MTTDTTISLESKEVSVPATVVVESRSTSTLEPGAIQAAMGAAFQKVQAFMKANGIPATGAPRVLYTEWGPTSVHFAAAVPVDDIPPKVLDTPAVALRALPESRALRFVHNGPYREIRGTYERIEAWLRERGGIKTASDWAHYSPMWEEYLNDPTTTPESELVTRIYLTLP